MVVLVFVVSVFEFVVLVFHAWPVPPGIDSSPKVFLARILLSVRIDFRASGLLILSQLRFSFANFLNSDRAERFRIFCLQYVSTSMPGCRCCHFRLNTPAQRTRGQCQGSRPPLLHCFQGSHSHKRSRTVSTLKDNSVPFRRRNHCSRPEKASKHTGE